MRRRWRLVDEVRGKADVGHGNPAGIVHPRVEVESDLGQAHGDRLFGSDGQAERLAAVGVEPRRDVHREDAGSAVVDGLDQPSRQAAHLPRDARPQQGVYGHARRGAGLADRPGIGDRRRAQPDLLEAVEVRASVARDVLRLGGQEHLNAPAHLGEVPRGDEAIAPVVPGAAEDGDVPVGAALGHAGGGLGNGTAGVLHERKAGDPAFLDRPAVQLLHLLCCDDLHIGALDEATFSTDQGVSCGRTSITAATA